MQLDTTTVPVRPRPLAPARSSAHLLVRLQAEWDRLAVSPRAIRRAEAWQLPIAHVRTLDDVLHHVGHGARTRGDHDDVALAHLVALARTDDLAARVVLQRLLPGVASIVRRRAGSWADRNQLLDEMVSTAWTVIRTYPVERRPRFVAVNLLRDVEYRGWRQERRRLPPPTVRPPHTFVDAAAPADTLSARAELAELLDLAASAGVSADDLHLARRLAAGATTEELAAERRVTARTIRNHRDALTHRLRAVAASAA